MTKRNVLRKGARFGICLLAGAFLVACLLSMPGCGTRTKMQTEQFYAMGALCSAKVYGTPPPGLAAAVTAAENAISHRIMDSVIARANCGQRVQLDAGTEALLALCMEMTEKTDGAFRADVLALTRLWDFDGETHRVPGTKELEAALAQMGPNPTYTVQSGCLQTKAPLDLGAVGKGYACDILSDILRQNNLSGIVAVGGSLGLVGSKPDGKAFVIGIRDPFSPSQNAFYGTLALQEGFVSTSGSYEKTFTQDGKTYHHILDARTGMPAVSDLVSATIVAESGALSDALSTACFLLGREGALALCRSMGAEAVLIGTDGSITVTTGLAEVLQVRDGVLVSVS